METSSNNDAQSVLAVSLQATIEELRVRLAASDLKYDILTKATNDAIRDWNIRSGTIVWNHGLYSIFGYDDKSQTYEDWLDKVHPSESKEVSEGLQEAFIERRSNWSSMYRFRCSTGYYKYVFDRGYIVYDATGSPFRMITTMQDLDERMVALGEIEKLSMVASRTDNLVIITDASEKIEWVNEGFVKRTGYTLYEVIGKTPRFMQGPDTDQETLARIRKKIDRCENVSEEVLNYTRNGEKIWIRLNINPVFDDRRKLVRLIAVQTEITQSKEYERIITSNALDLADLIENANAVIFGLDCDGRVNEWNKQATASTGYAKSDVLGKRLTTFVKGMKDRERVSNFIQSVLEGEVISNKEFQMINRSDEKDIFILGVTPRRNAMGEIVGMIAVGQDITELTQYRSSLEQKVKERTLELQKALEKEKELAVLKSRFASMVSHEFRTPLSVISISANQIKKYRSRFNPDELDTKLDTIQSQVSHMTRLMEDVLTIGRSEEGKILVTKNAVALVDLIMSIKGELEVQFHNSHTIIFIQEGTIDTIQSDVDLLRNILINLLSNAIKFSPGKQQVFLTVTRKMAQVIFKIRDEGIGIPLADQDAVFDAFSRGSNVSMISGTGLGLSIVKRASELLSGNVSVESVPGHGTTFFVAIPVS